MITKYGVLNRLGLRLTQLAKIVDPIPRNSVKGSRFNRYSGNRSDHVFGNPSKIIKLKSPVWGCPICILWGGDRGRFWAQSAKLRLDVVDQSMGQPVFALSLICVCFVSRHFLSLKGGPNSNNIFFHWYPNFIWRAQITSTKISMQV